MSLGFEHSRHEILDAGSMARPVGPERGASDAGVGDLALGRRPQGVALCVRGEVGAAAAAPMSALPGNPNVPRHGWCPPRVVGPTNSQRESRWRSRRG